MIIIGGRPAGRHIEQHDVFFGIGKELPDLYTAIDDFWPSLLGKWHIDAWREVNYVDNYLVDVTESREAANGEKTDAAKDRLYFINLGGYKENDMEEYHYKLLTVAQDKNTAIGKSKLTAFYRHTGFKGAVSHIDDKYSVDVDDLYELKSILPKQMKDQYEIRLTAIDQSQEDPLHIGYLKRNE